MKSLKKVVDFPITVFAACRYLIELLLEPFKNQRFEERNKIGVKLLDIARHNKKILVNDGDKSQLISLEKNGIAVFDPFKDETSTVEVEPLDYYSKKEIQKAIDKYESLKSNCKK